VLLKDRKWLKLDLRRKKNMILSRMKKFYLRLRNKLKNISLRKSVFLRMMNLSYPKPSLFLNHRRLKINPRSK
jgi:diacylglycerol kinase family enzyme